MQSDQPEPYKEEPPFDPFSCQLSINSIALHILYTHSLSKLKPRLHSLYTLTMQFTTLVVSALAAASAVVAAPLEKRAGGQGQATYYYQNGNPGSCGNYNSDSRPIVAVNSDQMNDSLCGQSVWIQHNGKTIEATIQDTCPTCSYGSLDLSTGAFNQLADESTGEIPITWWT